MKGLKAIYVRCSMAKQEFKSQINEIKRYLVQKGEDINDFKIYHDKQSGKSMTRPGLRNLQNDMMAGKVNKVCIYGLDRLSRQGTESVMTFLSLANSKGVDIEFVTDQYLNHKDPLIRNILITVLSELAKKEREKIVSRVKAGLEIARQNGKRLGRPPLSNPERIKKLRDKGYSLQAIADKIGVSKSVVHKYLNENGGHKIVQKRVTG